MKIEISPQALREIERKAASWAEHSTISPGLFIEERLIGEKQVWAGDERLR